MTQRILRRVLGCVLEFLFAVSTTAMLADSTAAGCQPRTPLGRVGHAMTYAAACVETVLFGGIGAVNTLLSDAWVWHETTWTRKAPKPLNSPSPRAYSRWSTTVRVGATVGWSAVG